MIGSHVRRRNASVTLLEIRRKILCEYSINRRHDNYYCIETRHRFRFRPRTRASGKQLRLATAFAPSPPPGAVGSPEVSRTICKNQIVVNSVLDVSSEPECAGGFAPSFETASSSSSSSSQHAQTVSRLRLCANYHNKKRKVFGEFNRDQLPICYRFYLFTFYYYFFVFARARSYTVKGEFDFGKMKKKKKIGREKCPFECVWRGEGGGENAHRLCRRLY